MKTTFPLLPLLLAFYSISISAQSFQLTVQNGYGSGQYAAGDTVHVWAKEWLINQTFSHWSGQTADLEMADEWHTRLVMPSHNVSISANTRNLPQGAQLTEEQFKGRDTIKQVFHYFPPFGQPKGVVWLFHGSGGSAEAWVNNNIEQRLFVNHLMADTLAVIITECEERTKNFDANSDGNIRWDFTFDSVANVDIANIRAIRDTFINRGWMGWNTPQIAEGFSAGGAFSVLIGSMLDWRAAINHNTPGIAFVIPLTHTPIVFSMTLRDNHPEVGMAGNIEAYENYQYLSGKGLCTEFYMLLPSPVYPQRFMRIPGISGAKSMALYQELSVNNCLTANNFLTKDPHDIEDLVLANPQNWPELLSLTPTQKTFMQDEVGVMWSSHHFHTDFANKDLRFIHQLCSAALPATEPGKAREWTISPNPVAATLRLPVGCARVRIFDIEGKLIKDVATPGMLQLDVAALPNGLFFIECTTSETKFTAKMIKQL